MLSEPKFSHRDNKTLKYYKHDCVFQYSNPISYESIRAVVGEASVRTNTYGLNVSAELNDTNFSVEFHSVQGKQGHTHPNRKVLLFIMCCTLCVNSFCVVVFSLPQIH